MNKINIGEKSGPGSGRSSNHLGYVFLGIIVALCIANFYELSNLNLRSGDILRNLREWSNAQKTKSQLSIVLKANTQIKEVLDTFKNMLDQQEFLLVKIKENHIDDNREESEIAEITNFQSRLLKYQMIFKQQNEEYKKINSKILKLKIKQKQKWNGTEEVGEFRNATQLVQEQLKSMKQLLTKVLQMNQQWYDQNEARLKQNDQFEQTFSDQDIEELPQYMNLPDLAKEILKPLPIELHKQLYKSTSPLHEQSEIKLRQKFSKERQLIAKQHRLLPSFSLTKYNIQSSLQTKIWEDDILSDYARLNSKFSLDEFPIQKGICIVVPTYNNINNFRAELNLNSIFSQNYTNYKVVIIDDASQDDTPALIQKYLKYYDIPSDKCELIVNKVNKKALQNIYNALLNNCQGYEITTIVDGDDEFIGFNVLKVLNAVYSRQKLGVVYSNFYFYQHSTFHIQYGFNQEYNSTQKQDYRKAKQKFSHLISFKIELVKEINFQDLQQNGRFYHVAYDFAMLYPLMELSCGRVKYIDEYQYLYSIGTGFNDYEILPTDQKGIAKQILAKPRYQCSKGYK